ncbi:hypothetical protein E2562_020960 [Oryza meyeriana var. granulata]|uniref:Uncharacterized protein n=1 Tax=Oryza meyeriana var. granulata TaxID=110450 RepID=A0A6G1DYK8_9ORYZ|nr:hypothetical protein E2562_020960 [Oryza meyeriana var. granulata]
MTSREQRHCRIASPRPQRRLCALLLIPYLHTYPTSSPHFGTHLPPVALHLPCFAPASRLPSYSLPQGVERNGNCQRPRKRLHCPQQRTGYHLVLPMELPPALSAGLSREGAASGANRVPSASQASPPSDPNGAQSGFFLYRPENHKARVKKLPACDN